MKKKPWSFGSYWQILTALNLLWLLFQLALTMVWLVCLPEANHIPLDGSLGVENNTQSRRLLLIQASFPLSTYK